MNLEHNFKRANSKNENYFMSAILSLYRNSNHLGEPYLTYIRLNYTNREEIVRTKLERV